MKKILKLEKKREELTRWLERVKVLKAVFIALVGIRLLPNYSSTSLVVTAAPVFFYLLVEEVRIILESRIRIIQDDISRKERKLEPLKSKQAMKRRKHRAERPR